MKNEIQQLTDVLSSVDKKMDTLITILSEIRNGDSIRNLAMSNFVSTQAEINDSHTKTLGYLTNSLSSWFEAEGKLKEYSTKN
jgi:hypothetical protein